MLEYDDVMKLDFGTHVDGNTTFTSCFVLALFHSASTASLHPFLINCNINGFQDI